MRFALFAAVLFSVGAAAQTFTIGAPGDGCTGGTAYVIPAVVPSATLRYGNFECSYKLKPKASYVVGLDFIEPNMFVRGTRTFDVALNGAPVLMNFDVAAAGGTAATKTITREFFIVTDETGGLSVWLNTRVRNAILSAVRVRPAPFTWEDSWKIDCANGQNCPAGKPATEFTLTKQACCDVELYRNGVRLYVENNDFSGVGQKLTVKVADGDYLRARYRALQ